MIEKEIHPHESLHIIQSMINTAKNKLADDGFLLIFWGWLVFVSALVNYILFSLNIVYGFLVWPILMPLGGIFTAIYSNKQKKKEQVKTYVDTYLSYLWTAFGIALAVSLSALPFYGIKSSYFCLMVVYGFVTYVSGGLLEFKALRIGSLFSFACAIASMFVGEKEQLLCIAVAILCSYIIPGHLLSKTFKSQHNV
jgi:nucleoside permease NupC